MIIQQTIDAYKIASETYENLRELIYDRICTLFEYSPHIKKWNTDYDTWSIDFEKEIVIVGLHYDDEKTHWIIKLSDLLNPDYLNELIEERKKREEAEKKKFESDEMKKKEAMKQQEYQTYLRLKKKFEE